MKRNVCIVVLLSIFLATSPYLGFAGDDKSKTEAGTGGGKNTTDIGRYDKPIPPAPRDTPINSSPTPTPRPINQNDPNLKK